LDDMAWIAVASRPALGHRQTLTRDEPALYIQQSIA